MKRAWLALALTLIAACPAERPRQERTLYFGVEPVATITEQVADDVGGKTVLRRARLQGTGEVTELRASLDSSGFAHSAQYVRGVRRRAELKDGALMDGAGVQRVLPAVPVALLDLLGHVQPLQATPVTLVDLASGDAQPGRVERRGAVIVALDAAGGLVARCNVEGARTGPGAFYEGDSAPALDTAPVEVPLVGTGARRGVRLLGVDDVLGAMQLEGPGQVRAANGVVLAAGTDTPRAPRESDKQAEPFIESTDAAVVAFARRAGGAGEPLVIATRLAEAVYPLVDAAKRDAPPSAAGMLKDGGDCDGAAALVTAAMRALGHAARPAVGYRLVEGRFVPHAWVEVYTASGWVVVDATGPRIGSDGAYLKLFDGLGSALTMGRVLGRLRVEPVP